MRKPALFVAILFTSCGHKLEGPSPELTGVTEPTPAVVCNAQLTTDVVIAGDGLAPLVQEALTDPNAVMPSVTVVQGETRTTIPDAEEGGRVTWQNQQQMTFQVYEELALARGVYDIEVCNRRDRREPDPMAGEGDDLPSGACFTLADAFLVVPPPTVTATIPDMVCTEDGTNTVTLQGTDFLIIDGALPQVLVGVDAAAGPTFACEDPGCKTYAADDGSLADCTDLGFDVQSCTSLTFTVPQADLEPITELLDSRTYSVSVRNPAPAACESTPAEETDLTAVPPPTVDANLSPDLICTADGANTITVAGEDFLSITIGTDVYLPTVNLSDGTTTVTLPADTVSGTCAAVSGPNDDVQACDTLTFTVPQDHADLVPGNWAVTVTNPVHPVATTITPCTSNTAFNLTIVPPPALETIQPDLLCSADGTTSVTITAALTGGYGGFLDVNGTLPTVDVGGTPIPADALSGTCAALPESPPLTETVLQCDTLTFTVPQGFAAAVHLVTVTNPVATGCATNCSACASDPLTLVVRDRPAVATVTPDISCPGQVPAQLMLTGTFAVVDGVNPTATFGGNPATVASVSGCSALAGPPDITEDVDTCTGLLLNVPSPGTLTPGVYDIVVTDPAPLSCASTAATFTVENPPTITGIVPDRVCEDIPESFTITGTNFSVATDVVVDPTPGVPGGEIAGTVTSVNPGGTSMAVDFVGLNPGLYDVIVSNDGVPDGAGCDDTLPASLTVEPTPFVFFADPPVVYSGISTQITVYATNINCDPDPPVTLPGDCIGFVGLGPAGGGIATIDLTASAVYDLSRPNRIQVIVPAEALGGPTPGSYDVFFQDALGCVAAPLPNGLNVTNNVAINLLAVDPPFGQTGINTAVTVTAETPPTGAFTADFDPTPRAYLNPTGGGTAAAVRAVAFVNDGTITGFAPAGPPALAPGQYDVIVVNPDGTVGVSSASTAPFFFNVTAAPPPVVNNLTPGSTPSDTGQAITVEGTGFDNPCPGTCPAVVFTCRAPGGAISTPPLTVDASTATTIDVTLDASGLADGTTCVVRVTNADGSFGDYSALSITNPSQNINNFVSTGQALNVGRRALSAVAGRATRAARFIYAIGGDDGAAAGALDTMEAASVNGFGVLSAWRTLPGTLPIGAPRTLAGAAVLDHQGRRFVYLAGGNDGTTVVDTVLRAEVLDPTRSPEIVNLDFTPDTAASFVGPGVPPGGWNYKVAALFDVADAENPNGESLPSDVQPVTVPAMPAVDVTIEWSGVPNAVGYRIYRSPTPGLATGTEELIATVGATTFYTDTGNDAPDPASVPLDIGDLGNWATVGTLNTPREGLGVAIAADPDTTDAFFLYALAGRDDTGAALDTYEVAAITVNPLDGTQAVGAFAEDGANLLATARWQVGGYSMDRAVAPSIPPGEAYVYVIGGVDGGGAAVIDADAALVGGDGTLAAWVAVDDLNPARAGFGAVGANDFLLAFAGGDALNDPTPIASSRSVRICPAGGGPCEGGPPNLENWNNDPATMVCNRYLMGVARESATVFLVGGAADDVGQPACLANPTTTTESTAW